MAKRRTVAQAYAEQRATILVLLEHIRQGLDEHEPPEPVLNRDWGYVGDLGYVREQLQRVSDFLNQSGEYAE